MAGHKKQKVTIIDVAQAAGVSKTTISRYINGKFEFMSDESRERIAKVIDELGYRPNNLARGLKSKETKVIGVIVADITSPFSPILLKGISDSCERYGYRMLIANTDDDASKERDYILSMIDERVDGIIINTTGENEEFMTKMYNDSGTPFILDDRMARDLVFDTVRAADGAAMYRALHHLHDTGYEHVGFFVEKLKSSSTRVHRYEVFHKAYPEIFGEGALFYKLDASVPDVSELQRFVAETEDSKRAIMTVNGVVTMRLMKAMWQLGLHAPEDMGICSFDDWDWMSLVDGGLTAVAQPTYRVGCECVKRMMYRIHHNKDAMPKMIELPCELIIRNST